MGPQHNILAEEQFGFIKNLKTEKATYELINEILSALNNGFCGRNFL